MERYSVISIRTIWPMKRLAALTGAISLATAVHAQTGCGTLSQCPVAHTPLAGNELLYLVQGGLSKQIGVSAFIGQNILPMNNTFTGSNFFSDVAAGGGTILVPGSNTLCTSGFGNPVNNPGTTYNCISKTPIPINSANTTDAYSYWSLLDFLAGPHSDGVNHYGYFFDTMAQGSGGQNPNADLAMGCNIIKQGYGVTAQASTKTGEIDCMYVIARGVGPADGSGNSPVGGILVSSANVAGNGTQNLEGSVEEIPTNYDFLTPVYAIDTQIGALAHYGALNIGEGFIANAVAGANIDAFLAQNSGSAGTWVNVVSAVDSCGSSGYYPLHITLQGIYELSSCDTGVIQPYWLMSNVDGIWTLASGASTLMMVVDQSGNATVYGAFTAPSLSVGGTAVGSVCIDVHGHFFTKTSSGSCT